VVFVQSQVGTDADLEALEEILWTFEVVIGSCCSFPAALVVRNRAPDGRYRSLVNSG
jgi:hypothetical protein